MCARRSKEACVGEKEVKEEGREKVVRVASLGCPMERGICACCA